MKKIFSKFLEVLIYCSLIVIATVLFYKNSDDNNKKDTKVESAKSLNVISILKNSIITLDIDGDGKEELINFRSAKEDDKDIVQALIDGNTFISSMTISDQELIIFSFEPAKFTTLLLIDDSISDGKNTLYFQYINKELIQIGSSEGKYSCQTITPLIDMSLEVEIRSELVQTSWYQKKYKIQYGSLIEECSDFYELVVPKFITSDIKLSMLKSCTIKKFRAYNEPSLDSDEIIIPADVEILFCSTDSKNWIRFMWKSSKGDDIMTYQDAYLYVEDNILINGEKNFEAQSLFTNLFRAY